MFTIEPFEKYFPLSFANGLTKENAIIGFRNDLEKWGQIEQSEHEKEVVEEFELPDGAKFEKTQFKDPAVRWARSFIITSFYNLCCLAARKKTIEELIFEAWNYRIESSPPPESIKAFNHLLGISNAFLQSEWSKEIFYKATANDDVDFFKKMGRWLVVDTPKENFTTARKWLGVTMLWYLGGKDISPRREFMNLLKLKGVMSGDQTEESFNAELRKLRIF